MKIRRAFACIGFSGLAVTCIASAIALTVSPALAIIICILLSFISGLLFLITAPKNLSCSDFFLFAFIGIFICGTLWSVRFISYNNSVSELCDNTPKAAEILITEEGSVSESGYNIYTAEILSPVRGKVKVISKSPVTEEPYTVVKGIFTFSASDTDFKMQNLSDSVIAAAFPTSELLQTKVDGYYFGRGIAWLRKHISEAIKSSFSEYSGVIRAMVLGQRKAMSSFEISVFCDSGLSHVVAVSGLHVGIFTACLGIFLSKIKHAAIRIPLFIIFLFGFAALCGFSPSVLRASVMTSAAMCGTVFHRTSDPLNNLGFAVFALVVINPLGCISPSLLLSACATLGIVICSNEFGKLLYTCFSVVVGRFPSSVLRYFIVLISTSFSAFIFTLPLCILFFGKQSLIAIVANLFCLPLAELLYPLYLAATFLSSIGLLFIGKIIGLICLYPTRLFMGMLSLFANLRNALPDLDFYGIAVLAVICLLLLLLYSKLKHFPDDDIPAETTPEPHTHFPVPVAVCTVICLLLIISTVITSPEKTVKVKEYFNNEKETVCISLSEDCYSGIM